MKRYSVTIIGMGPRGLSVFERIAAVARTHDCELDVNLIEPGECGPGVHSTRQPQHLLINTVASQVTTFPAPGMVAVTARCAQLSLTEWAVAAGYRRFGDEFLPVGMGVRCGAAIGESDYLPRQLLGQYLMWAYAQLKASLPPTVSVTHYRQRALDLQRHPDGSFVVELANGATIPSDYVVLTTGHSNNSLTDQEAWLGKFARDHARYNSKLAFVRQVYPLDQLGAISNDASVAIQGLGLTAHDVVSELTVGRGGRFIGQADALRYQRSGREPTLILYSRNCLPAAARGVNQKGLSGRHQARFFTREAVAALRAQALATRRSGQLDFDVELLPLLLREMGLAYRLASGAALPDPDAYVLGEQERVALDALMFPLRARSFHDRSEFAEFVLGYLRCDLQQAELGNLGSPVKAAADVLRDARAALQEMIEHAGLTPASHRKFLSVYNPIINRITFGPPRQRNRQLLALIEAGVVELAAGPNPALTIDQDLSQFVLHTKLGGGEAVRRVDVLVMARLDVYSPETDDTPFTRHLLKRGIIRPFYNGAFHPGGIDIDAAGHPLSASGAASPNLWALGYPVEGPHYYTHALPRPMRPSRQVSDAECCVGAMFASIAARESACATHPALRLVADAETL